MYALGPGLHRNHFQGRIIASAAPNDGVDGRVGTGVRPGCGIHSKGCVRPDSLIPAQSSWSQRVLPSNYRAVGDRLLGLLILILGFRKAIGAAKKG